MTERTSHLSLPMRVAAGGFALGALLLVVLAGFVTSAREVRSALERAERSGNAVRTARALREDVADLATGLHGYELTGNARFLAPWRAAAARLPEDVAALDDRDARLAAALRSFVVDYSRPFLSHVGAAGERLPSAEDGRRRVTNLRAGLDRLILREARAARAHERHADAAGRRAELAAIVGVLAGIALILGFAAAVRSHVTIPVRRLALASDRLASGDLQARARESGPPEVRQLARSFNTMADRLSDDHDELEERVAERTQQLELARTETLQRLARAAEARDGATQEHAERIGELAVRIGWRLGLHDAWLDDLRRAAPLHDIGKVSIPDAVLLKPARLTPAEMDVVRRHTTGGAAILAGSASPVLRMAEEIALTHHERWDGRGYPFGLEGSDIPLSGRIVAVADVFDALISERPYKAAWPVERAIAEIRDQAGRHFDPGVVAAFLAVQAETGGLVSAAA
jgi:CHASE3 domain sensor protein